MELLWDEFLQVVLSGFALDLNSLDILNDLIVELTNVVTDEPIIYGSHFTNPTDPLVQSKNHLNEI